MSDILLARKLSLTISAGMSAGEKIRFTIGRSPVEIAEFGVNLYLPMAKEKVRWKKALSLSFELHTARGEFWTYPCTGRNFRRIHKTAGLERGFFSGDRLVASVPIQGRSILLLDENDEVAIRPHRSLGGNNFSGAIATTFDLFGEPEL